MIFKVLKTIDNYEMLKNTDKIIVALSGGADSVALTHLLYVLSKEKKFSIKALHVNHCIRKDEALRDENFVKNFCNKLNIELTIKRVDVLSLSKTFKLGVEEMGRKVRYEILKKESFKYINSKIATAHTLSDNVETVLMRLLSGTALKGLCGIPATRENIIRPLISIKRSEIENYCKKNNLEYVNDSSNFEKNYTRNKIRLDIIPKLKSINNDLEEAFNRAIFSLNLDESYLDQKAEKIFKNIKIDEIKFLLPALKNRVLIKIIKSFTDDRIEQKHISNLEKIINKGGGKVCIPGGKILKYQNNNLTLYENTGNKTVGWEYLIKPLNILTEIKTNIIIKVVDNKTYLKLIKNSSIDALDFEKIPTDCVFRNRRPKDEFKFSKRKISKSLKKLFNEMKIPPEERNKIPILAYKNEILWIDKVGVSRDYLPTANSKKIAIIIKEHV